RVIQGAGGGPHTGQSAGRLVLIPRARLVLHSISDVVCTPGAAADSIGAVTLALDPTRQSQGEHFARAVVVATAQRGFDEGDDLHGHGDVEGRTLGLEHLYNLLEQLPVDVSGAD